MCSVQCGNLGGVMALTKKQQLFVEEYLKDLNATQAAIRAGYSAKTAYAIAEKLLRKAEIKQAIQEAMKARSDRTEITQDRVLQELARLAFFALSVSACVFALPSPSSAAIIDHA